MRIGIDARMYSSNFTGIGRYTYELIKNILLLDTKNEYRIFLNKNEYEKADISGKNVQKVLADIPHYSLKEQVVFPKLLREQKPDLMHFTHFNAPIFYRGSNIIVTIHDLTLSLFPGKKMTSFLHRFAYSRTIKNITRKAKKIIAVSENTKKDIMSHLNIDEKKIQVIYEGVADHFRMIRDEEKEKALRKQYGLQKPYLLYTGVWRDHKNVTGLIKAFKIFRERYQEDCDLVITGKRDFTYNEVPETIQSLGLEPFVKLVGLVPEEDLVLLNNFARVYVFPSFYEGFGLPPLEAMACGTVVATSSASCLPEICGEGNAVFFNPWDVEDMAKKIFLAYSDEKTREILKKNGIKRLQDFSWEKMAQETLRMYHSL